MVNFITECEIEQVALDNLSNDLGYRVSLALLLSKEIERKEIISKQFCNHRPTGHR